MAARARGSIAAIVAASLLLQVQLMLRRALGAGQGSRLGEAGGRSPRPRQRASGCSRIHGDGRARVTKCAAAFVCVCGTVYA